MLRQGVKMRKTKIRGRKGASEEDVIKRILESVVRKNEAHVSGGKPSL